MSYTRGVNDFTAATVFRPNDVERSAPADALAYMPDSMYVSGAMLGCSIEHGNLIADSTRTLFKKLKAFLVPTMITHQIAIEIGEHLKLIAKGGVFAKNVL